MSRSIRSDVYDRKQQRSLNWIEGLLVDATATCSNFIVAFFKVEVIKGRDSLEDREPVYKMKINLPVLYYDPFVDFGLALPWLAVGLTLRWSLLITWLVVLLLGDFTNKAFSAPSKLFTGFLGFVCAPTLLQASAMLTNKADWRIFFIVLLFK